MVLLIISDWAINGFPGRTWPHGTTKDCPLTHRVLPFASTTKLLLRIFYFASGSLGAVLQQSGSFLE